MLFILITEEGVENQVPAVNAFAQKLPFANSSFFMIGKDHHLALKKLIWVTKNKGRIGIAEPMCLIDAASKGITCFDTYNSYKEWLRTLHWNSDIFSQSRIEIPKTHYYENDYQMWVDNFKYYDGEKDIILQDNGRWLIKGGRGKKFPIPPFNVPRGI